MIFPIRTALSHELVQKDLLLDELLFLYLVVDVASFQHVSFPLSKNYDFCPYMEKIPPSVKNGRGFPEKK
jgi:hypothetical protein